MMALNAKSVLITGSSRGIGLEFVKQLIKLPTPPQYLFATCRNPEKAENLQSLKKDNSNLHIISLDICDEASIEKAKETVENELKDNGLNLLINNAGLKLSVTFEKLNFDSMMEAFKTNAVAPSVVTRVFFPLLKTAAAKHDPSTSLSCNRAAVVNISSILGSITATRDSTFFYEYSASKAALNMITKDLGIHLRPHNVLAMALHPGWVQTDMGGKKADLTPESCVKQSLNMLSTLNESNTGLLIDYKGTVIPCTDECPVQLTLARFEHRILERKEDALNMVTKNFSVEFRRDKILSLAVNPGWVSTDMGGPKATMTPTQSIEAILNLLANVKNEQNGQFLDYNGKLILWSIWLLIEFLFVSQGFNLITPIVCNS